MSNYLAHYGIKGMKWGTRNAKAKSPNADKDNDNGYKNTTDVHGNPFNTYIRDGKRDTVWPAGTTKDGRVGKGSTGKTVQNNGSVKKSNASISEKSKGVVNKYSSMTVSEATKRTGNGQSSGNGGKLAPGVTSATPKKNGTVSKNGGAKIATNKAFRTNRVKRYLGIN